MFALLCLSANELLNNRNSVEAIKNNVKKYNDKKKNYTSIYSTRTT